MSLVANTANTARTRTRAPNLRQRALQPSLQSTPQPSQPSQQSLAELESRSRAIVREIEQLERFRPSQEIDNLTTILNSPNELLRYTPDQAKDLEYRLNKLETKKDPEYTSQLSSQRSQKFRLDQMIPQARIENEAQNQRNIDRGMAQAGKKQKNTLRKKQKYTLHKKQKNRLPKKQKYTLRKKKAY